MSLGTSITLNPTISPGYGQFYVYDSTTMYSSTDILGKINKIVVNGTNATTTLVINSDVGYINDGLPYNRPVAVYNNYLWMLNLTNPYYNGGYNCKLSRVNLTTTSDFSYNMLPNYSFLGIGATFISPYLYHFNFGTGIYRINLSNTPLTPELLITIPKVLGVNSQYYNHIITTATSNNNNEIYGFGYYSISKSAGSPQSVIKYNVIANTLSSPIFLPNSYNGYNSSSWFDLALSSCYYNNTLYVSCGNTSRIYSFSIKTNSFLSLYYTSASSFANSATLFNGNIIAGDASPLKVLLLPPPPTYTTPFTPTITSTISNSASQLTVSLYDASNTAANEVTYLYSTTGTTYADTGVAYTGSTTTYTFTISKKESGLSLTDISFTLYVKAQNGALVSGNATSANVIVYQIPNPPGQLQLNAVGAGNVQVIITETSPIPYYYLNNVSYYLYAYNNATGTNLSGNTSLLVYNIPVGILSNTNVAYGNIVSYVNTGLTANTYTMYVIAKNSVGNSNPISANIAVLFPPSAPSIDTGNTKSLSSGNLTISINDTVNTNNPVYYLYSLDGINYGNSRAFRGGNTRTVFTVSDTGNAQIPLTAITYTLYITASNSIGNSAPTTAPVIVYTTPQSPTIDASNTQSLTSGNLTVYINDTVNILVNGIYYLYSMDGTNYGNSGVPKTGNTANFTISNTGNAQVPLTSKTYTLYIAASNPVGNSISNPATAIENVYTTPSPPTIDQTNTKSVTSGNLNVAFTDTFNNGNNQVEYTYFMYDSTAAPLFFV